jgi:AcrR family transcriptional regulator
VKTPPEALVAIATPPSRATPSDGDLATRDRVIQATVTCILQSGYYRASTNEIARTAGVTWGVIQHYFGTRERLMLAVLQEGSTRFAETVERAHIEGATVNSRLTQLLDIFCSHYSRPEYLADLQILLNMDRDPRTSAEVRKTMLNVAERSNDDVRRLLREALGPAASTPDLATTVFLILRGFGLSQQLMGTMSYDTLAPKRDRIARQRRLLADILTPYFERTASEEA